MLKSYKYRIYPNKNQEELIIKHFGCCRFIYNFSLELKIKTYQKEDKSLSQFDMNKLLPKLKKKHKWLKEVIAQSLQQEHNHLDKAFRRFFKEKKGFPKFKSKKDKKSFSIPQNVKIDFKTNRIKLPKIGSIKARLHREFVGRIKTTTVSMTPTDKYFISICVEDGFKIPHKQKFSFNNTIGIDVGLKHFATLSTDEKIENPKYLKKKIERLKILQKRASKKKKGSANRRKANKRVAIMYEKITNQRRGFLHKLTHKIVGENQAIAIESLNIQGMIKNHHLAQSITDASWHEFFRQLGYKCNWNGKTLLEIGRFEPSSRICSVCGTINNELNISMRKWTCKECNTTHDRDVNASVNIKQFALQKQNLNHSPKELRGVPAEMSALVESKKQEAYVLKT